MVHNNDEDVFQPKNIQYPKASEELRHSTAIARDEMDKWLTQRVHPVLTRLNQSPAGQHVANFLEEIILDRAPDERDILSDGDLGRNQPHADVLMGLARLASNGFFGEYAVPFAEQRFGSSYHFNPTAEDLWEMLTYTKRHGITSRPVSEFIEKYRKDITSAFEVKCAEHIFMEKVKTIQEWAAKEVEGKLGKIDSYEINVFREMGIKNQPEDNIAPEKLERVRKIKGYIAVLDDIEAKAQEKCNKLWEESLVEGKKFAAKALLSNRSPFASRETEQSQAI